PSFDDGTTSNAGDEHGEANRTSSDADASTEAEDNGVGGTHGAGKELRALGESITSKIEMRWRNGADEDAVAGGLGDSVSARRSGTRPKSGFAATLPWRSGGTDALSEAA
ncbi:hypothetical protein GN958_ATG16457, partial [Phytophthora infestans]